MNIICINNISEGLRPFIVFLNVKCKNRNHSFLTCEIAAYVHRGYTLNSFTAMTALLSL